MGRRVTIAAACAELAQLWPGLPAILWAIAVWFVILAAWNAQLAWECWKLLRGSSRNRRA